MENSKKTTKGAKTVISSLLRYMWFFFSQIRFFSYKKLVHVPLYFVIFSCYEMSVCTSYA